MKAETVCVFKGLFSDQCGHPRENGDLIEWRRSRNGRSGLFGLMGNSQLLTGMTRGAGIKSSAESFHVTSGFFH